MPAAAVFMRSKLDLGDAWPEVYPIITLSVFTVLAAISIVFMSVSPSWPIRRGVSCLRTPPHRFLLPAFFCNPSLRVCIVSEL